MKFIYYQHMMLWLLLCCWGNLCVGGPEATNANHYEIVLDALAIDAERTAASELQHFILKSTGSYFPIVTKQASDKAIYVGQQAATASAFSICHWSDLRPDEICLKSDDGNLFLAGDRPRGSLYAVYEFLERHMGVRFWTPHTTSVPRHARFSTSDFSYRYAPPFEVRSAGYDFILADDRFAVRSRNNGFLYDIPEKLGGDVQIYGGVHTFCDNSTPLIAVSKYYSIHPEWFSLVGGKRLRHHPQLCLSNAALRRELVKNVLSQLRSNPDVLYFSVSQNDWQNYCQCDECSSFVARHGNQTDLLIDAVNEVARAVAREFPHVRIETLAYGYTRHAPESVRPASNVVIRYCKSTPLIMNGFADNPAEKTRKELLEWKACAGKMMIWNYVTNFKKYYLPNPNWDILASDLRLFRDCGAINVFEQGSYSGGGPIADLSELRGWVLSKLLWNPDLSQEALIDEFLRGYYGEAASGIVGYMSLMKEAVRRHPDFWYKNTGMSTSSWLDDDLLRKAYDLFVALRKRHSRDKDLSFRIACAAVPVQCALLERRELFAQRNFQDLDCEKILADTVSIIRRTGIRRMNEARMSPEQWETALRQKWAFQRDGKANTGLLPQFPDGREAPAGSKAWSVASVSKLIALNRGCFKVKDRNSVSPEVIRMPTTHKEWYVQIASLPLGMFDVYCEVRCQKSCEGNALVIGAIDTNSLNSIMNCEILAKQIAGNHYQLFKLGKCKFDSSSLLFMAPVISQAENVWIDRLIFIPAD